MQRIAIDSLDALMRWLDDTIAGLDLDHAHLVGASYGAWLALHYAVNRPERVHQLTLVEPVIQPIRPRFFVHGIAAGLVMSVPGPQRLPAARRLDVGTIAADVRVRKLGVLAFTKHRRTGLPKFAPVADEVLMQLRVPTRVLLGARSPMHNSVRLASRLERVQPSDRGHRGRQGGSHPAGGAPRPGRRTRSNASKTDLAVRPGLDQNLFPGT